MSSADGGLDEAVSHFQWNFDRLLRNIDKVVRGKEEVLRNALICLFAQGHLLIEDVPGVAKTLLAKAIARSIGSGQMRRIQFTPDLLPLDVLGVQLFNQRTQEFTFREGPVFCNILLGDEINRATPKTQSALLEVMAERRVTIDGVTREAPWPFLCIATQNPIEHHGTFPLPEAQLDRFMMRINVGYPSVEDETQVIVEGGTQRVDELLEPVIDIEAVRSMMRTAAAVTVSNHVARYVATLAAATRGSAGERRGLQLGVSPRGSVALAAAAQALAASEGRTYVIVDDVKALAIPVLSHRLILSHRADAVGRGQTDVVASLLTSVPVPGL